MLTRPMNDGEKGLMQMYVNNGYDLFLTRCSMDEASARKTWIKLPKVVYGPEARPRN